jgi:hypothetical protein
MMAEIPQKIIDHIKITARILFLFCHLLSKSQIVPLSNHSDPEVMWIMRVTENMDI